MSMLSVVLLSVVVLACGFWAGKQLFKRGFEFDTRVEDRRRAAAKLAGVLAQYGLVRIPDLLIDYSVGDYSGMGEHVIEVTKLFLSGERAVLDEFEKVFTNVLDAKLSTREGRAYIIAKLDEASTEE